jgi:hypothetical protein
MSLTKEQLLQPRYLCTGTHGKPLWHNSFFTHGDVIQTDYKGWYELTDKAGNLHLFKPEYFLDFPHLFKPLPWWYGRKPDEMPTHVRSHETGRVYKRHEQSSYEGFDPATEEEYLKQKEG